MRMPNLCAKNSAEVLFRSRTIQLACTRGAIESVIRPSKTSEIAPCEGKRPKFKSFWVRQPSSFAAQLANESNSS